MLNNIEIKTSREIENKYYMQPMLESIIKDLKNNKLNLQEVFSNLYGYLLNSKDAVERLLKERVDRNEIKDISQARKSIAGSAFSNLIIWVFLKNKESKNIDKDIFITNKISQIPHFKDLFYIKVGEETQKPDVDLVIYRLDSKQNLVSCLILSLKTSLRERAGQTYKWKLPIQNLALRKNTTSSITHLFNL